MGRVRFIVPIVTRHGDPNKKKVINPIPSEVFILQLPFRSSSNPSSVLRARILLEYRVLGPVHKKSHGHVPPIVDKVIRRAVHVYGRTKETARPLRKKLG
jgi:hypothetical protein